MSRVSDVGIPDPELERVRAECESRLRVVDDRYTARTVVPPGTVLYDPLLGFADDDGTVVLSDIGGQAKPGWDPEAGHGAIYRLHTDDRLETVVPPGGNGQGMIQMLRKAPASFAPWGGHIFFTGQSRPGRRGALAQHWVYRLAPRSSTPEPFAHIPPAGSLGGGVPGAAVVGGFGEEGTPHEGRFLCATAMNCVIYAVEPSGVASPLIVLDVPWVRRPLMPYKLFYALPAFGDHEGALLLAALEGSSFERPAPQGNHVSFYVVEGDHVLADPVGEGDLGLATAVVAPRQFGPYAGHTFTVEMGSANMMHVTKPPDGPLPFDARIVRIDPAGVRHVFADRLQSGFSLLLFDGPRLLVSYVRRSYSTGEYHLPDGSIDEIRFGSRG